MKHDPDNHFNILQCPCCGQGIGEREFFDISETLQRDTLRYLYKRIDELENSTASAEIYLMRSALRKIQLSANDCHPTAIWMQKVAAHALNPKQWPEQPDTPPINYDRKSQE